MSSSEKRNSIPPAWDKEIELVFDGKTLTEPSLQVKRNVEHKLILKPKAGGVAVDELIAVGYNGPADLGITLRPIKPQMMAENGIEWTILGGVKCGHFVLEVTAPTMVDAPLDLKGEQL